MDNIVETLAKFKISALLVIGGFEVKPKTSPFKEPEVNYLYRASVTSKRFSFLMSF